MNSVSGLIPVSLFTIVMLGWFGFATIFLFRQKPPKAEEQKRDRASIIGIVLQGLAYALIWSIRWPFFTAISDSGTMLNMVMAVVTLLLEERLLREKFGRSYDEYAAKVLVLLPLRTLTGR